MSSLYKIHVFRLSPHQDLKISIMDFARLHSIKAGIILTCVGSVEQYNIRFANEINGTIAKGPFEIISLTGTFSDNAAHLHISVSDRTGKTTGGHLLNENLVYTTAEIAVAELTEVVFNRVHDPASGYPELLVTNQ
jgi:predicted DNA-binding protein with PD1-like motif